MEQFIGASDFKSISVTYDSNWHSSPGRLTRGTYGNKGRYRLGTQSAWSLNTLYNRVFGMVTFIACVYPIPIALSRCHSFVELDWVCCSAILRLHYNYRVPRTFRGSGAFDYKGFFIV
jgi:hypothetical protein